MSNDNNYNETPESIDAIKNRLSRIEEERRQLIARLGKLHGNSPASKSFPENINVNDGPLATKNESLSSQAEKLTLFRSFFRGRDDVFARFWVSKKNPSKKGYSPVCKNEWVEGKCEKPAKKCSSCDYKEYVSLSFEILAEHLTGKQIVGIYPLLPDESCYFLAVDFDGEGWMDNVFTFKETCGKYYVPVAIERSRSGNGAHAWIFFQDKVPAKTARQMGSFLITETMNNRYKMSMRSYDRLFPNQDNIPKEGLGNLIALPFQKYASVNGNSLFIDKNAKCYDDQWDYLSRIPKMPVKQVEELSADASAAGKIIGVRTGFDDEQTEEAPWNKLPSGKRKRPLIIDSLPFSIDIVLADRLYMKTENLPSPFLNQVKRVAAFQNQYLPAYHKDRTTP